MKLWSISNFPAAWHFASNETTHTKLHLPKGQALPTFHDKLRCPIRSLPTSHLNTRSFPSKHLPNHINSIPRLGRVLILEMVGNFLEPSPHLSPLIPLDPPQKIQQEPRFHSIWRPHKYAECRVIQDILIRKFDFITDYHWDTMADDGIKEAVGWGGVSRYIEAEFGRPHPPACLMNPTSLDTSKGEVHILLIFEEIIKVLANWSSLRRIPTDLAEHS